MSDTPSYIPVASDKLQVWLDYLEKLHPTEIDMGLERVSQVAANAGVLTPAPYVITVGGTNGKGSTVCYLEEMLSAAGYKTAVYTSPHIVKYEERVRINRKMLPEQSHAKAFSVINEARQQTSLTYFEFGTLAALHLIKQADVDVAILEVGLGGRLDAVNCVEPDVSVITSVGIDHIAFLGDNREQIGREKAGIARNNKPLICGDENAPESIKESADTIGAKLIQVGKDFFRKELEKDWEYRSHRVYARHLPKPKLPLINASTAIAAIEHLPLPVSLDAIKMGLISAALPGRMQVAQYNNVDVLLDVAHNPQAAAYASRYIASNYKSRPIYAVIGMLSDKDHVGVKAALQQIITQWFVGTLKEPRGEQADKLAEVMALTDNYRTFDSVNAAFESAIEKASQCDEKPLVFVFGSFYTVSSVNQLIVGA